MQLLSQKHIYTPSDAPSSVFRRRKVGHLGPKQRNRMVKGVIVGAIRG